MNEWLRQLREDLRDRRSDELLRELRPVEVRGRYVRRGDRELINLAGNDYLGLSRHPRLIAAVVNAAEQIGVGSGASRLITGHRPIHQRVERRFAAFKHDEAALLLPTGYMANLAAITALVGPGDVILLDKLNHASLIDAARASGADVRIYPHGNLDKLDRLLRRYRRARRRLIASDSVFSMDGDCADLPALCALRDRYEAILMVDEAHATGVLGAAGSGLAERQGVADAIDVTVSTASKALGSMGGIISSRREVIEMLVNAARSFIYTTAVPPTQAAAVEAALDVVRDEPQRREQLHGLSRNLRSGLRAGGWRVADDPTPIVPLVVGEASAALRLADRLERAGFFAPAIRPPTVPPGASRVRIALRTDLLDEDIERLIETIGAPQKGLGA